MVDNAKKRGSKSSAPIEVQRGVEKAAKIYDEFGDLIYAMILFQCKNESVADDIFQEFFLSLVNKPIPQDIENIKSYIYKSLIHDIIDYYRREKSYKERNIRYSENYCQQSISDSPDNNITLKEETEKTLDLIATSLPTHEAQTITERYYQDNSIGEVAKKLKVDKRTVSRYLCTGLKKLRGVILDIFVQD